jgi:hypothetical protein
MAICCYVTKGGEGPAAELAVGRVVSPRAQQQLAALDAYLDGAETF